MVAVCRLTSFHFFLTIVITRVVASGVSLKIPYLFAIHFYPKIGQLFCKRKQGKLRIKRIWRSRDFKDTFLRQSRKVKIY